MVHLAAIWPREQVACQSPGELVDVDFSD